MHSDGINSALSPVVYGDIAPSINTQYYTTILYYVEGHAGSRFKFSAGDAFDLQYCDRHRLGNPFSLSSDAPY